MSHHINARHESVGRSYRGTKNCKSCKIPNYSSTFSDSDILSRALPDRRFNRPCASGCGTAKKTSGSGVYTIPNFGSRSRSSLWQQVQNSKCCGPCPDKCNKDGSLNRGDCGNDNECVNGGCGIPKKSRNPRFDRNSTSIVSDILARNNRGERCDNIRGECKNTCADSLHVKKCQPCVDPFDPCKKPFVVKCVDENGVTSRDICVEPPECLMKSSGMRKIFNELKQSIIYHRLDILLKELDEETYDQFVTIVMMITSRINNGRIVIALPDGTVVVDTFKNNTWEGYQERTINENHNTRICFMDAQDKEEGVGYERKLSSTTGNYEKGVAIRLGEYLNCQGTIRLSAMYDEDLDC